MQELGSTAGVPLVLVKITDIQVVPFRTHADRFSCGEAQPRVELVQTLIRISTDAWPTTVRPAGRADGA
jgi:hypothetical protein